MSPCPCFLRVSCCCFGRGRDRRCLTAHPPHPPCSFYMSNSTDPCGPTDAAELTSETLIYNGI